MIRDKDRSEAIRLVRYCHDHKSTIAQRAEIEAVLGEVREEGWRERERHHKQLMARIQTAEAEAKVLRAGLEEVARQAHECGGNYNYSDIESTARAVILEAKR